VACRPAGTAMLHAPSRIILEWLSGWARSSAAAAAAAAGAANYAGREIPIPGRSSQSGRPRSDTYAQRGAQRKRDLGRRESNHVMDAAVGTSHTHSHTLITSAYTHICIYVYTLFGLCERRVAAPRSTAAARARPGPCRVTN
jgi:hypothetical protein